MGPRMLELFHSISDEASARVRRFVVDHELLDAVRFRNITYAEVQQALQQRGGQNVPALWDGHRLIEGVEAITARLVAAKDVGRESDS